MITLDNISKSFGSKILFDNASISFSPGNRYGLTGPNGAGKSTLLKIMMGKEEATYGKVSLPKKTGMLRQDIEHFAKMKVIDVVIMGNQRLWNAMQERDKLYEVEFTDAVGMRLGDLEGIIAEEDGYSAEAEAETLLSGMGIAAEHNQKAMEEIPTDQQFRVLLCQALFGKPEALLLDEPTNHLDLESIGWLELFLKSYSGTLIVISHDRHFLNAVTTHIADIDYETIIVYPGNYDEMIVAKSSVRSRTEQDNKNKEKKIAQLKEFVAKFGAGTRASQVQSRIREINKLQPQELKQSNIQRPYIRFKTPEKQSGKIVFKIEGIFKGYDGQEVIHNFSLEVDKGDKIGIIGNNGRGKTTLVKMIAHELDPDRGQVTYGHQVDLAYFPQNHSDVVDKSENINLFDWLQRKREGLYEQEIRGVLGRMLFSGDDAFKKVSALSGGETARLILASMMLQDHNTIVLDEPNNHLDLEAVSALAWGLEDYKGTVVLVSHDRSLIDEVATKIISFEKEGVRIFQGKLEEYLECTSAKKNS
jgi:ATPase subunit of ABC transporter with duplicated ATPase domains